MTTQSEAVAWLNAQISQHLDYDHEYGQQCVDFFNFYYQYESGDNPYADGYSVSGAKDLWNIPNNRLTKIPDSSTLVPEPGDICVYGTAWGTGYGHVEMVISNDDNGCTFVGENEHNDPNQGVVTVYRTWAQMRGLIGVMRFTWQVPIPPPVVPLYTITPIIPKQVMLAAGHSEWNLALADFSAVAASPFTTVGSDTVITVVAELQHSQIPQYTYYLQDAGSPLGWNTLDCTDYTPPPSIITPPPYIPPAAPISAPPAETYTLLTPLPTYAKEQDALSSVNSVGTLPISTVPYYVWNKSGNAYQLGTDNQHTPTDNWINILDNVPPKPIISAPIPPPPAPVTDSSSVVIGSFKWFHADTRKPEEYEALKAIVVYDMVHGGTPIRINIGQTIEIYGHFVKDGHTYLRPLTGLDQQALYYFYGIRTTDTDTFSGAPFLESKLDWIDKAKVLWESYFEKAVKSIDGVFRRKK